MSEVSGNEAVGGLTHLVVSRKDLDLFDYTRACEEDRKSPNCKTTLYLAGSEDRRVHSAYIKSGNVEETKVRPDDKTGGKNDFWTEAQQKMDGAYRTYTSLISGLGEALRNGSYDPKRRAFRYNNQDIPVHCRAEASGALSEMTFTNLKDHILMDTTDPEALAAFDGKLKCDPSNKP